MQRDFDQIYLKYFRLGERSYREKVKFYEENPTAISSLLFEDKIEIDMDYMICLFEVGRYERFLSKVDPILETIIIENIFKFRNENIFNELIFKKASCLFNVGRYDESMIVLKQLIKMDPTHHLAIGLYGLCKRKLRSDSGTTLKAFAISALLLVIGITVTKILLIEPFFDVYLDGITILQKILFGFSLLCFISLEIYIEWSICKDTGIYSYHILNKIFSKGRSK